METLADRLDANAGRRADALAFRFLPTGDVAGSHVTLTHGQLNRKVERVAARLRQACMPGDRALLFYPSGLDFVVAFLACLRAGVIAVPVAGPGGERPERALARAAGCASDCAASLLLTTAIVDEGAGPGMMPELALLPRLVTDLAAGTGEPLPSEPLPSEPPAADAVAFIQYTSGSTGSPRGVMVTHANLTHNLHSQQEVWRQGPGAHVVSWLPAYHDMGLIGGLLHPLYIGAGSTVMAPEAFIQRPLRWLEAISAFGGTLSCAPDFAYELCARAGGETDISGLDLSAWAVAGNGAEPVRAETFERFAKRFAPVGFRRQSFTPGYGLAESTLVVAGVASGQEPRVSDHGVSCGRVIPGARLALVSPATGCQVPEGEAGEIWVHSPSNAAGYWNRPALTRETFDARLAGHEMPFLRTGDLGVLQDGELYVTGRIKDLIIVGGRNHYPQDVEQSVERAASAVRRGCVAAFTAPDDPELVIVAEVREAADPAETVAAIRAAVSADHGLDIAAVVLIEPRTLPKTTSGKIRRGACRDKYLSGALTVRHEWRAPRLEPGRASPTAEQIESWLIAHVALHTGLDVRQIDAGRPFGSLGLASADAVALSGQLARWLGRPVAATVAYDHPTIDALARHLAGLEPWHPAGPGHDAAAPAPATREAQEPVAIIGIGCRFPGADGPDAFWKLLSDGTDAVGDVPADRWDLAAYLTEGAGPVPGRMYTGRGGFLGDVAGFDPAFFGMPDAEARYLDPQQRLLLELAWEAFEDAGVLPRSLAGTEAGVFVGITTSDYAQVMRGAGVAPGPYAVTGNIFAVAANRISYTFDLHGPSIAVDTACSSSLVAIYQACVSLRRGDCDVALAGGVNLMISPDPTIGLCQAGALSPDGHCYTFDARANGYARGEGGGLVMLKPLSRALADGDRVYAVIRGCAVNQDGRTNGLTAPSTQAQVRVIKKAHRDAGLEPGLVRYVEAHGTGTALGDPIEAAAIGRALAADLPAGAVCAVGSAKSNIGHLEAAAGVAGVIKVALSLYHRALPPSLHFDTPNEHIDFAALRLTVPTALQPWPAAGTRPAAAGVSSFGVGGTNAHAVLDMAPSALSQAGDDQSEQLFVLSARTPAALTRLAERVAAFLPRSGATLAELAASARRRTTHEHRLAVAAGSVTDLSGRLRHGVRGRAVPGRRPQVVFVFPGQGPQYIGMAQGLYESEPAFASALDECDLLVQPRLGWSPRAELFADEQDSRLHLDEVAQVMLFSVQAALSRMWQQTGVAPDAVLGHSMGEVAAAFAAGALDLPDAVRVTCLRARLLSALRGQGAMAVVGLSRQDTESELGQYADRLHLAAVNGPELCVVSGEADAIDELAAILERRDVFCRRVKVGAAGHSPMVDEAARELAQGLAGLVPQANTVPLYSSVTGDAIKGDELDAAYWGRNLRQTVMFHPALERLIATGYSVFLELSPNPTLVTPIQDALRVAGADGAVTGSLTRTLGDRASVLEALGALWAAGYPADLEWPGPRDITLPVVSLPSGPWQHEACWFDGRGDGPEETVTLSVAQIVRRAFSDVLRVASVNGGEGFFELGGTSLMAAQMLHDLRTALAMEIPLRLLFDNPTPDALSAALQTRCAEVPQTRLGPVLTRVVAEDFPLTINQERLLLAEHDDAGKRAAHVFAQHLVLDGPVDRAALACAVHRVVALHAGLNTGFCAGGTRQVLGAPPGQSPLTFGTVGADAEAPDAVRAVESAFCPGEPLYRFHLLEVGGRGILCTAVSHLITDGWSQGVILQDLIRAYEAALDGRPDGMEPPPLRLADYAVWERATLSGAYLEDQMTAWQARLAAARPPRPHFIRQVDPAGRTAVHAGFAEAVVGPELQAALAAVGRACSATSQMIMLTAYLLALSKHSGQGTVTVPISWSARDRPDLARVTGFLSQPQLITCDFTGASSLRDCLRRVRDAVLDAGEQRLSMSQYFHLAGKSQDEIPFRISMNYMPPLDLPARMGGAAISLLPRQSDFTLFRDILLLIRTVDGSSRLSFIYADDLIAPADMEKFAADLVDVLGALATDPLRPPG